MRASAVTFLQPGIDFRGASRMSLTVKIDKVELQVNEHGWIEVLDLQTHITHMYPPSLVRQAVVQRSSLACPHCGKLFRSTGGMGNHVRLLHSASKVEAAPVSAVPAGKPGKRAANG